MDFSGQLLLLAASKAALLGLNGYQQPKHFALQGPRHTGRGRKTGCNLVWCDSASRQTGVGQACKSEATSRSVLARYVAEVGDVVVGRVTEIAAKRWKVDLNARRDAALMLSAVNLPGGIQRRRTAEDELNMRAVYEEGDMISLSSGQLITVPANLVKRQKQHFHSLEAIGLRTDAPQAGSQPASAARNTGRTPLSYWQLIEVLRWAGMYAGVDLIIGCNGMIWVARHGSLVPSPGQEAPEAVALTAADHQHIARAATAVEALAKLRLTITAASIQNACQAAEEWSHATQSLLGNAFLDILLKQEADRRLDAGR
ncbi:hypothetical protein MMC29_000006 [Sticta canariensis]|nr:hypothetical protein [Sticta canariensis]